MQIEELIREYRNEVHIAGASFFTWKCINNAAFHNPAVARALNRNALSWNHILHSLNLTFFIALGRIFDRDSRSLTIHKFLGACREEVAQFSKASLEARRLKDSRGNRPDYLDEYLEGVYEATPEDFRKLELAANDWANLYRANYEPIRHKVMAHKDLATLGSRDKLYAKTKVGEVEEMLRFLYGIEEVVSQLHLNGRLTTVNDHPFNEEALHKKDVDDLVMQLASEAD